MVFIETRFGKLAFENLQLYLYNSYFNKITNLEIFLTYL